MNTPAASPACTCTTIGSGWTGCPNCRFRSQTYTPGDWLFDPVALVIYDGQEANSKAIATVEERQEPTEASDETSHNGWVMAAAPQLLRELKVAVMFLERMPPGVLEQIEAELDWGLAPENIFAAIAKAEGR